MTSDKANCGRPSAHIPAAEYLRVSHEEQRQSLPVQSLHIRNYASEHRFVVVKTYVDLGRSGLVLHRRPGLQSLLRDVVGGVAPFKAILVDDLSRWGRFQDTDESAHYEFLCKEAGVPVHYCSEAFHNDGTLSSSILKNLQRMVAGEYSRELSDKCFKGQKHLVELGFRVGGCAGYGFRRMLISADGSKRILRPGEYKGLATDRVVLVRGPNREVNCVRKIFQLELTRKVPLEKIARELNKSKVPYRAGKPWRAWNIRNVLTNPKYAGLYVWNRTSSRLHAPRVPTPEDRWVTSHKALPAIVDKNTFDRVQHVLHTKQRRWSREELIQSLERLRAKNGYISEKLVRETKEAASLSTYHRRLGRFSEVYSELGYSCPAEFFRKSDRRQRTQLLHDRVIQRLSSLFPRQISIVHLPGKRRPIVRLESCVLVSVLICNNRRVRTGSREWVIHPAPAERENVTLLCFANKQGVAFSRFYLIPRLSSTSSRLYVRRAGQLLKTGFRLNSLLDFSRAVNILKPATTPTDKVL